MKIDLTAIPTTFDSVHAALAATVVGLFFLQILFLLVAMMAIWKKGKPVEAKPEPAQPVQTEKPGPVVPRAVEKPRAAEQPAAIIKPETLVVREATPEAALQLLGLLQKEARFIDFIQENVAAYSDAEIGAAARVVHEGCRKVLRQHFVLEPVRAEVEGHRLTLPKGFDAASIRLTGNIVGEAPFTGTLVHRGWKVTEIKLPRINEGHDTKIVAAAEVEL